MKLKAAAEIGIYAEHVQLPKSITEGELLGKVRTLRKHSIDDETAKVTLVIRIFSDQRLEHELEIPRNYCANAIGLEQQNQLALDHRLGVVGKGCRRIEHD